MAILPAPEVPWPQTEDGTTIRDALEDALLGIGTGDGSAGRPLGHRCVFCCAENVGSTRGGHPNCAGMDAIEALARLEGRQKLDLKDHDSLTRTRRDVKRALTKLDALLGKDDE